MDCAISHFSVLFSLLLGLDAFQYFLPIGSANERPPQEISKERWKMPFFGVRHLAVTSLTAMVLVTQKLGSVGNTGFALLLRRATHR